MNLQNDGEKRWHLNAALDWKELIIQGRLVQQSSTFETGNKINIAVLYLGTALSELTFCTMFS